MKIRYSMVLLLLSIKNIYSKEPFIKEKTFIEDNVHKEIDYPHVQAALMKNSLTLQDLENFLYKIDEDYRKSTTDHLEKLPPLFKIAESILQNLENPKTLSLIINGKVGTRSILLLSSALFRLGINSLTLYLISEEPQQALKSLNRNMRFMMCSPQNRFQVLQVPSLTALNKKICNYHNKPQIMIMLASNHPEDLTTP